MSKPIRYLDLEGLKALYGVVDGKITSAVSGVKTELKGEVSADYDTLNKLEGKIKDEVTRATGAETALGGRLTALESGDNSVGKQIEALENKLVGDAVTLKTFGAVEDKIDIITGEGEGSIKRAAADAVAGVIANAPEDFDTLKEVADWINSDTTGAAKMQADIAKLQSGKDVEGSVANSIDKAVNALDATVGGTTIADGNHVAVQVVQENGKLTGLTVNENDIASADALGTVKSAQEANTALLEGIPTGKKVKGYVDEAVAAAKSAATTKVAKAADAAHLTVTAGEAAADGSVTYTIGESNIASADALAAEVNRATDAEAKALADANAYTDGEFGKRTTIKGYGITDAKIEGQTITLGDVQLQFVAYTVKEIQDAANQ